MVCPFSLPSGSASEAILGYEAFVKEGLRLGRRPDLIKGGLIRGMAGWAQVLSLRGKGINVASDDIILGNSEFVEALLSEAEERERETLRLSPTISNSVSLKFCEIRQPVKTHIQKLDLDPLTSLKAFLFCRYLQ